MGRVTIKDVANDAGVSITTASFAINHRTGRISEAAKEKVLASAEKLGYVPNINARNLRTNNSNTYMLVYAQKRPVFVLYATASHERRLVTLSGSVSPLPWTGSKGCIYTTIDAFMPPHKTYVEACMGSAEVFLRKRPSEREIINDYNGDLVKFFRVLQRSEKLAYLIGRLYLSFNSEQLFKANKAMLADVPNILDDLTETSVIIENADWSDIEKAVAFFENQIFSFSSTGKTFAIAKKDMTKRFGRLVAACSRLRNAVIMHRDYKDCIAYNDILSFEEKDANTIILKKEKLCGGCTPECFDEVDDLSIEDFLDSLTPEQQRKATIHLNLLWAQREGAKVNNHASL